MSVLCVIVAIVGLCLMSKSKVLGGAICGFGVLFFVVACVVSGGISPVLHNDLSIFNQAKDKVATLCVQGWNAAGEWLRGVFLEFCTFVRDILFDIGIV